MLCPNNSCCLVHLHPMSHKFLQHLEQDIEFRNSQMTNYSCSFTTIEQRINNSFCSLLSFLLFSRADPSDHELCGPAGGPGVRPGQGAVPRPEPGHPLRLHRRDRGEAARRLAAVLALPRTLRENGRPALPRESGTIS